MDNDNFHSRATSEDICSDAMQTRSDWLRVFIFPWTVMVVEGASEDFEVLYRFNWMGLRCPREGEFTLQQPLVSPPYPPILDPRGRLAVWWRQ